MSHDGNKMHIGHKTQIIVAIIGVVGVIVTAVISNWDNLFSGERTTTTADQAPAANANTFNADTSSRTTGYVIQDSWNRFRFYQGVFPTNSECVNRVIALGDKHNYALCRRLPNVLYCAEEYDEANERSWLCYDSTANCLEHVGISAGLNILEHQVGGQARVASQCRAMRFEELNF